MSVTVQFVYVAIHTPFPVPSSVSLSCEAQSKAQMMAFINGIVWNACNIAVMAMLLWRRGPSGRAGLRPA